MSHSINVETASTKELVAFYNEHAHDLGKKTVVKFTDRATAQLRVKLMIEDLEAEEVEAPAQPSTIAMTLGLAPTPYINEGMKVRKAVADAINSDYETRHNAPYNLTSCPKCGSEEIYTGRNENGFVVDENLVGGCHQCDWEYDVRGKTPVDGAWSESREAMKSSLKLDRTITCLTTQETWGNAFQMWKQHTDWMTSAQQDNLTAKLYKAAKQGQKIQVTINERTFELVNVKGE